MEGKQQSEIRIYVACLAAYNAGKLHGAWINAQQEAWDIYRDVRSMLATSPILNAEEWAIHDYEGFEGLSISEYEDFETVAKLTDFIAEHGKIGAELITHFGDLESAQEAMNERYAGEYESLADFAREITEQTAERIPDNLAYYIDYEAMGRDLAISDIIAIETRFNQVHVFWGQ